MQRPRTEPFLTARKAGPADGIAFMPEVLARIAPRLGAEVVFEPEFQIVGHIRFPNGRRSYFWHNKFNLNSVSAARIASDKGYTVFFLQRLGFRVPRTGTFFREGFRRNLQSARGLAAAWDFARELGCPVYLKPCRGSQGDGVTRADDEESFLNAARRIFERNRTLLVQEACAGRDYRLVVLDGEVISAYERVPLSVCGDGCSTISGLLAQKQAAFDLSGRDTRIPMDDPRITVALSREGMARDSVPEPGRAVTLLEVSNLSCGGTTLDITGQCHPSIEALAAKVAEAMDLRFAGIDILTTDAATGAGDPVILEVNSAPGLDHYAASGPEHLAGMDELYLKVLSAIARGPR